MERLGERWLSVRVTVERDVAGFGLEYACAHIIILAEISSENLLPIRADSVTERVILGLCVSVRSMALQGIKQTYERE